MCHQITLPGVQSQQCFHAGERRYVATEDCLHLKSPPLALAMTSGMPTMVQHRATAINQREEKFYRLPVPKGVSGRGLKSSLRKSITEADHSMI